MESQIDFLGPVSETRKLICRLEQKAFEAHDALEKQTKEAADARREMLGLRKQLAQAAADRAKQSNGPTAAQLAKSEASQLASERDACKAEIDGLQKVLAEMRRELGQANEKLAQKCRQADAQAAELKRFAAKEAEYSAVVLKCTKVRGELAHSEEEIRGVVQRVHHQHSQQRQKLEDLAKITGSLGGKLTAAVEREQVLSGLLRQAKEDHLRTSVSADDKAAQLAVAQSELLAKAREACCLSEQLARSSVVVRAHQATLEASQAALHAAFAALAAHPIYVLPHPTPADQPPLPPPPSRPAAVTDSTPAPVASSHEPSQETSAQRSCFERRESHSTQTGVLKITALEQVVAAQNAELSQVHELFDRVNGERARGSQPDGPSVEEGGPAGEARMLKEKVEALMRLCEKLRADNEELKARPAAERRVGRDDSEPVHPL
ncbi:hypothetical protein DIPPA_35407 [Diplonema papillatum]|nr:hypothetical protein DIPPA_35407 [Diplonema papillatum]